MLADGVHAQTHTLELCITFHTSELYGFSMISTLQSRDHRDSPEAEASSEHTHAVPQLNSEVPESPTVFSLGKAKWS